MYPIGHTFYNYQFKPCTIESYDADRASYLVRENGLPCLYFWSESDLDRVMSKQQTMLDYAREQAERDAQRQAEEQRALDAYNNVHGFCDTIPVHHRAKVIKTLNVSLIINGVTVTRKQWVEDSLRDGHVPKMLHNVRKSQWKVHPLVYAIVAPSETWIEVTKTEYDYAVYLLKHVINVPLQKVEKMCEYADGLIKKFAVEVEQFARDADL